MNTRPSLCVIDLGRQAYASALRIQEERAEARKIGTVSDTLLLVEHEPVYTLGRNARESHVLASPAQLAREGIEVVRTGRGGDVTYHGPGQLVGYPIIDLRAMGKGVLWYVGSLEQALIRVLADFGLAGATDPVNRGVWIGRNKIAAIGVRVSRHITQHGFSLNVHTDLTYYRNIVPCGLPDRGVTSLHLLAPSVSFDAVKASVVRHFRQVLGYAED